MINSILLGDCIGSGTTAIAAINTGRQWIGMERDAAYYEVARNRISQHVKEKTMKSRRNFIKTIAASIVGTTFVANITHEAVATPAPKPKPTNTNEVVHYTNSGSRIVYTENCMSVYDANNVLRYRRGAW